MNASHDPHQGHRQGHLYLQLPPADVVMWVEVCGRVCVSVGVCTTDHSVEPSAAAFFQGTLYSALITGTLERFHGSKYSDLEVTRKTLVLIHSKYWRHGGEQREGAEKLSR